MNSLAGDETTKGKGDHGGKDWQGGKGKAKSGKGKGKSKADLPERPMPSGWMMRAAALLLAVSCITAIFPNSLTIRTYYFYLLQPARTLPV